MAVVGKPRPLNYTLKMQFIMITQIRQKPDACQVVCKNDTLRNINALDVVTHGGESFALVEAVSSDRIPFVELEFIPLDLWTGDKWTEDDVVSVVIDKQPQEGVIGPNSFTVNVDDHDYDHEGEEQSIIDNAQWFFNKEFSRREIRYA